MKTYIVDSFTDTPFRGNPAGVCCVEEALDDHTMLQIAQELNLSETAFVQSLDDDVFSIRFFSPKMEIALCGHATLASAKVMFARLDRNRVHFKNRDGLDLVATNVAGQITLEFPVYETEPKDVPPAMLLALGIDRVKNSVYNQETKILLLETTDVDALAALAPDFVALQASHDSINGVLVTAPSGSDGYDFHSRYFWPWSGTNEDPVTGGTHTFLAKYWGSRLGKAKMRSFQASRRGGSMEVELVDDKLLITSQAVVVFEGRLVY